MYRAANGPEIPLDIPDPDELFRVPENRDLSIHEIRQ